jgi:hypothetical protein
MGRNKDIQLFIVPLAETIELTDQMLLNIAQKSIYLHITAMPFTIQ